MSSRIGFSASIGTNMLPGSLGSSVVASRTTSEPTPTIVPLRSTSAAPLQPVVGGLVKIASSSMYSQFAENGRRDTTYASAVSGMPPQPAISTGSRSPSFDELPSGTGATLNGTVVLSSPRPVA